MAKIGEKLWKNERFKEWGGLETGCGFMGGEPLFFSQHVLAGLFFCGYPGVKRGYEIG